MSFTISRNKMTFASTEARSSLKITTTDDKAIEKGTTHVIATLSFNANDAIHHGHALIACSFPSTPVAQLPSLSLTCTAGGYVETIPFTVATQSDNFMRGHCVLSQCSAYTEVKVNITAQAGAHFIAKANTAIHVSLEPNDAMLTESIMPVPPALPPPASYAGAPQNLDAANIDPLDPHRIYFYKGDNFWIFNIDTEAQVQGPTAITTLLSNYTPGDHLKYVNRGSRIGANAQGEDVFHQVNTYSQNQWSVRYQASNSYQLVGSPGQYGHTDYLAQAQTADRPWWVVFRLENGVFQVHHAQGQSTWEPYGPGTAAYPTLPAVEVDACVNDMVNGIVIVWQGATMYKLNTTNKTVISSHAFGS